MSEIHAVTVPKWGLSMEEGTIREWHIAEGEGVSVGVDLVDIETSKITNTLEAQNAGTLRRILAQPGQTLPCGRLIGVIADDSVGDDAIERFIEARKDTVDDEAGSLAGAGPEPAFVEVDGKRIRYLELGSGGIPVLFVHGFGGDLENWTFNQPALAQTRRTIAVDLLGHGGSEKVVGDGSPAALARPLAGILDLLEIDKAHVIAHSYGALVAAELYRNHPDRIASLSALGPMGFGRDINTGYTDGLMTARRRSDMSAAVQLLFANEGLATTEMAEALLRYRRLDGVLTALKAIAAYNFPDSTQAALPAELWQALGDKLLVVWGAKDKVIPSAHLDSVPAGARRSLVEDAGHMPHLEKAEEINAILAEHLMASES